MATFRDVVLDFDLVSELSFLLTSMLYLSALPKKLPLLNVEMQVKRPFKMMKESKHAIVQHR